MGEWTEQEAFNENNFKVGDKVMVYSQSLEFVRWVKNINSTRVEVELTEHTVPQIPSYHFKQCRLLKKREPKRIKLCKECVNNDYMFDVGYSSNHCNNRNHSTVWYVEELDETKE